MGKTYLSSRITKKEFIAKYKNKTVEEIYDDLISKISHKYVGERCILCGDSHSHYLRIFDRREALAFEYLMKNFNGRATLEQMKSAYTSDQKKRNNQCLLPWWGLAERILLDKEEDGESGVLYVATELGWKFWKGEATIPLAFIQVDGQIYDKSEKYQITFQDAMDKKFTVHNYYEENKDRPKMFKTPLLPIDEDPELRITVAAGWAKTYIVSLIKDKFKEDPVQPIKALKEFIIEKYLELDLEPKVGDVLAGFREQGNFYIETSLPDETSVYVWVDVPKNYWLKYKKQFNISRFATKYIKADYYGTTVTSTGKVRTYKIRYSDDIVYVHEKDLP